MFVVKKILGIALLPLSVSLALLLAGLAFLWFTRRQTAGRWLVTLGSLLLLASSLRSLPYMLLKPLESAYPPICLTGRALPESLAQVKWIIVLGGGHHPDPGLPITSGVSAISLTRLAEGVRLQRMIPGSRLVLSGGGSGGGTDAAAMAMAAGVFGVDSSAIVQDSLSSDTEQQAIFLRGCTGEDRTILVTSAAHMPRAVGLFRKAGLNPLPAPTDYLLRSGPVTARNFYPTAEALEQTKTAVYEYLGIAWGRLRGKL
jgi:uncharacterized SAM-binding protein YcdF (DUF218 family)